MQIKGIDKAITHMRERRDEISGRKQDAYRKVGELASLSIKKNVEAGGRPTWRKRKKPQTWPILDKTGLMRDKAELSAMDWQRHATTGGTEHINKIISTLYGYFHQYGKGQVKRPYVLFHTAEINAMMKVFRDAFLRR